jgi:hypothetical protein
MSLQISPLPPASHDDMSSEFPIVPTAIDTSSDSYTKNRNDWEKVLEKHEEALRWCISEGQDKYVKRHIERGMLLCIPPLTVNR